jgi:DNA-binding MarR family transcriptional regulator
MKEAKELAKIFPQIFQVIKKNSTTMIACEKEGLTHTDLRILYQLYLSSGKMVMKELASGLGVTSGTLTTTIKRVITKKYCKREQSEEDGRQTFICLTKKGHLLLKKENENLEKNLENLFSKMTSQERKSILTAYKSIYKILQKLQG